MPTLVRLALSSLLFAGLAACGAASSDPTTSDDELRGTERGFEYTCTTQKLLVSAASTKVTITPSRLRFEGDFGKNDGTLDKTYHAPKGTKRVRYTGFETGEDCTMKVVADEAVLKGEARGQVRIQCAGDDFLQDLLTCSSPRATTLKADPPPPPAPQDPAPPASAKKWECNTSDASALDAKLTMQVVDGSIRVVGADALEYTGTRDKSYHPRSGNWIQYDNVEYGGDCSMTLVVDGKVLASGTTSTTLKVRCAGDDFVEGRYTCTPK